MGVINCYGVIFKQEKITNEERDILCSFILSATKLLKKPELYFMKLICGFS